MNSFSEKEPERIGVGKRTMDWTESEWFKTWLGLARHAGLSELGDKEAANFAEPVRFWESPKKKEGE